MTEAQFKTQKAQTDCAQAFLTFMALVGDVERTAYALKLDPEFVQRLADDEGWTAKIQRVSLMSRGQRPGDWERAVNRAMIFVQAHQLRGVIDSILGRLRAMTPDQIYDQCLVRDKNGGTHLSAKFLTDLTTAMEASTRISLVALGDTVSERIEREESKDGGGLKVSDLHAAIIAGLSKLGQGTAESIVLEQAQTVQALSNGTQPETQPTLSGQEVPTNASENPAPVPASEPPVDA